MPELPPAQRYSINRDDKGHANAKERKQVRANWDSFVNEAELDAGQEQQLLQILADMQQQYIAYQHGVNDAMAEAMHTHDPDKVKEEADNLRLGDFAETVEAELRSRVRKVLDPTQYGLFRRWSLDDAVSLRWGVYLAPTEAE